MQAKPDTTPASIWQRTWTWLTALDIAVHETPNQARIAGLETRLKRLECKTG